MSEIRKKMGPMKHGLYARYFDDLEETELAELSDEIDEELKALRVSAARLFERASDKTRNWEEEMRLLESFGRQCIAIASLVRTKRIVDVMGGKLGGVIAAAIDIVSDEWRND